MTKCKCENTDVIGCVRIKIKGTLLHRREYDQILDSLCPIEPGDIVQIIRRKE